MSDHQEVAADMNRLTDYYSAAWASKTEQLLAKAITKDLGQKPLETAGISIQLGELYMRMNQYRNATHLFRSAIQRIQITNGLNSPDLEQPSLWLASGSRVLGELTKAEISYRLILDFSANSSESHRLIIAMIHSDLGELFLPREPSPFHREFVEMKETWASQRISLHER